MPAPREPRPSDAAIGVRDGRVLLRDGHLTRVADLPAEGPVLAVGRHGDVPLWAVAVPAGGGDGLEPVGLRELHDRVGESLWALAGRAVQLLAWDRDHAHCGRCATPTVRAGEEHARRCPRCGLTAHPRVAPAVIVLVERDGTALLARAARGGRRFHSTLAGFVEPGETLEEAVAREVREEVGIEVAGIRYFGSQPWPFPHSLMVGFRARHAGGELRPDGVEIAEAGWYPPDALPPVPPRLSIARSLIDDFRRRHGVAVD